MAIERPAGAAAFARWRAAALDAPADIASLALFRVLFGTLMAIAMVRFIAKGWVTEFFTQPAFFFTYEGFAWVRPLPDPWMHGLVVLVAIAAAGIAAGCHYRISAGVFFCGFTWLELIDKTTYLNHYYLVSLLAGLLVVIPAHRAFSIDAWRRPSLRASSIPVGVLNLLRFQIAVVYLFAGVAKLNADWLLRAQPLRIWLQTCADLPLIGPWLTEEWIAFAASWAGAVFDLSIVAFLTRTRTRIWAYAAVVAFHLATACLFRIGLFPWLMMVSALLYFPPDFPRRWFGHPVSVPAQTFRLNPGWILAAGIYILLQLALPLRSVFAAHGGAWDYAAFNFSWRVMIAEKRGAVELFARDKLSGHEWRVPPADYLTPRQEMMMAQDPWMIRAFARHVACELRDRGRGDVEIRADAYASLNGNPSRRMIDPRADLVTARIEDCILPARYW
jgi:hypothetical protein